MILQEHQHIQQQNTQHMGLWQWCAHGLARTCSAADRWNQPYALVIKRLDSIPACVLT